MSFDLTGALEQIQGMGNTFVQRIPYLLVALVIALPSFRPGQLVQMLGISSVADGERA